MAEAGGWAQRAPGAPLFTRTSPVSACREGPRPARSTLDELLGRLGTGEPLELKLDGKYQRPEGEEAGGSGRWGAREQVLPQPITSTKPYIGPTRCAVYQGDGCREAITTTFHAAAFIFMHLTHKDSITAHYVLHLLSVRTTQCCSGATHAARGLTSRLWGRTPRGLPVLGG